MWSKGLTEWIEGKTAYISVAFSWRLEEAYQRAVWLNLQRYRVRAGGPATFVRKDYLRDVAELGGEIDALPHHNPDATMASRGCPVGCYFCSHLYFPCNRNPCQFVQYVTGALFIRWN